MNEQESREVKIAVNELENSILKKIWNMKRQQRAAAYALIAKWCINCLFDCYTAECREGGAE